MYFHDMWTWQAQYKEEADGGKQATKAALWLGVAMGCAFSDDILFFFWFCIS